MAVLAGALLLGLGGWFLFRDDGTEGDGTRTGAVGTTGSTPPGSPAPGGAEGTDAPGGAGRTQGPGTADPSAGPGGADGTESPGTAGREAEGPPVHIGWARISPARTPGLCVTEGRERGGGGTQQIAVQVPCAEDPVPRTRIEPVGNGRYFVEWHHPRLGRGCLTGIGGGLLQAWLKCRPDAPEQTFRIEPAGPAEGSGAPSAGTDGAAGATAYRLRSADGTLCWGLRGDDVAVGAEVVRERCTGGADQRFLIGAD
ncbi:hypothetical protein IHE55_16455 [Streptomyces pactum]|uniref:Ricin B lectin domain-containing protein n=1 Tax=Streptomyces pactum TaxID=68249 RepID=A0ABS0NM66_9ACTN|nr:hypothetical protein [Streptomyces pactum]MBH5336280.1 hypothetical protein [Streptomyces pactum]